MKTKQIIVLITAILCAVTVSGVLVDAQADIGATVPEADINTFSSYNNISIQSYYLKITPDFTEGKEFIQGEAKIEFKANVDTKSFKLDAWHYEDNVSVDFECLGYKKPVSRKAAQFSTHLELNQVQGGYIQVQVDNLLDDGEGKPLPNMPQGQTCAIYVTYKTKQQVPGQSTGYTFVKADATHGQKKPVLYTQNEPIYARTWFPCFDTPMSMASIYLDLYVPKDLKAYSSAGPATKMVESGDKNVYTFEQVHPKVATYQFSFIIGDFTEKKIESSTDVEVYVVGDASVIDDAFAKLKELPTWINYMSQIIDVPYLFKRFEAVLMPPNYPFEGAQHGQLTYVSPSLLKSGKTGETAVFHEIASNYFGNMMTCSNWRNLWINEGISTYLEREAQNLFFGELYPNLDKIIGNNNLERALDYIERYKLDKTFKSLHPNTLDKNPEESFTQVPYEKGAQFMMYIEQLIKSFNVMKMLKALIEEDNLKAIDRFIFEEFATKWIKKNVDDGEALVAQINFKDWMETQGPAPKDTLKPVTSSQYETVKGMANKFIQFNGTSNPKNYRDVLTWNQDQVYAFLDEFIKYEYMTSPRLITQLDNLYSFHTAEDFYLLSRWFTLVCLHRYNIYSTDVQVEIEKFMGITGRAALLVPIYEALVMSGQLDQAQDYLRNNVEFYHPATMQAIEAVVFREINSKKNE